MHATNEQMELVDALCMMSFACTHARGAEAGIDIVVLLQSVVQRRHATVRHAG
jgi:hypothetical protein